MTPFGQVSLPADVVSYARRGELRFLTCGSVDDGKSTLIGRLIADASGLLEDQAKALQEDSRRFGTCHGSIGNNGSAEDGAIDFALLLDGLEAEREQGITLDVAYRFFATARRAFVVADAPGHQQYTRNMVTGASNAELAVLLVDARKGLLEQTRRHAAIVSLLGIRHLVLAVNKIDLVDFAELRFRDIEDAFTAFAAPLGFTSVVAIPLSARHGDNVASLSNRMPWYQGPALVEHLEAVETNLDAAERPFRFPVQWVNRPDSDFRGFAGTVASGQVAVGDRVVAEASGRLAEVARIVTFDGDLPVASVGRSVTLVFKDEIDLGRGDLLADPRNRPTVARRVAADLVWMDDMPALPGKRHLLKIGAATVAATITRIVDTLDVESLRRVVGQPLLPNGIARVEIETATPIAFDPYCDNSGTGAFILIDPATGATVAAGMAAASLDRATNVHHQPEDVTPAIREGAKGQRAMVVWLTGLPGSGKSTIANAVERKLLALGRQTMLLDGDNLRQGLNADLGFDTASRTENVRRVGEVAKLMADAGLIVLVALVSPFRADRARAASLLPGGRFLEVFVDTPVEICRLRDPKGLYAKAARGKIANVTGRDQPYEPPESPDLVLRTLELDPAQAADLVIAKVLEQ
ncbi:MAG: adenylyl-sulfate kinase [Alphaproteobacteria bacterium]|nr:adenylyl-sulfate kinase [Alphaproteobacteria bacterium]